MLEISWLIPALPLAAYALIAVLGRRLPAGAAIWTAVAATAGAAALAAAVFVGSAGEAGVRTQELWTWVDVGGFEPRFALRFDPLSLVMALVVAGVGLLILVYSAEYMRKEDGVNRFFAYMSLFVASMLVLVLADDLLLLYLGWEGVGLCSYLLIGFWYRDPRNGYAARKAFIVTRIGDAAMAVALFLVFTQLGTLDIGAVEDRAAARWAVGSPVAVWTAALLLCGAIGKSAQLPLQVWLPDAMAGPTPVSALIHAATMVTAGVFLIARLDVLFELAPAVLSAVAVIGAATLFVAGLSALAQHDIKRVLAYSTVSQLGYMFLALGVGAYSAAIFHLVTHAFFKALLFLSAGAVIKALGGEHDLFRMGGLRRRTPVAFWTMLIAGASLAALPLVTAGFYSKDLILYQAWASERGAPLLWLVGLAGAFVTAVYIFRLIFLAFFGRPRSRVVAGAGPAIKIPLVVLAGLSIVGGFIQTPATLGGISLLSDFLSGSFATEAAAHGDATTEGLLSLSAAAAALLGVWVAYRRYVRNRESLVAGADLPATPRALHRLFRIGFGFDRAYDLLLVRPFLRLARLNRDDFLDAFYDGVAAAARIGHRGLSRTQDGRIRAYAGAMALGVVVLFLVMVLA